MINCEMATSGDFWIDRMIDRSGLDPSKKNNLKFRIALSKGIDGAFRYYIEHIGWHTAYSDKLKCKLEKPISSKTGEPLKPKTILAYKRDVAFRKEYIEDLVPTVQLIMKIREGKSRGNVVNLAEYRRRRTASCGR